MANHDSKTDRHSGAVAEAKTSAQIIARHLAVMGCKHAFGMPGGEVLILLDALREAGIEFTLCKHENAAGYMAEGSWQATGAPGILLTTIGPGLSNAINSVANALQEQVPLIVLSGCIDPAEAEQYTHQVVDQSALMAPVTKAQFKVARGTAAQVIQKALAMAVADPPGPVHVDLPVGLAAEPAEDIAISARVAGGGGWPDEATLKGAAAHLAKAQKPIILAGLGALHHGAGAAITALAQARDIPVITTYKAKGVMDEADPLCLGGHGLSPLSDTRVLPLLKSSDCVLLAGYDPIEMRGGWTRPWAADSAIELSHADVCHGMHGSYLRVVGDISDLVSALHAALPDPTPTWPDGAPQAARRALKSDFSGLGQGPDHWGPHAVFRTLQAVVPEGAVITADSGAHRILLTQMWQCTRPRELLQSAAFCTMGVAVPLAIGHAIAAPETPVIAVVGDAGFDMSPGDLATLRDTGLPVIIIVLVDDSLALIEKKQKGMQLPRHGVLFPPTDIPAVARAYGGHGAEVSDARNLEKELAEARMRNTFSVICCRIDKNEYSTAF
ncbi:similar to acetolactate synthase large subunit [hydrothermal vent metagenome]|uniref:Similar to acetolactate synthase large subunit n=1 Tax=hydrothermal vent metagenome TaxID=652676 RepID=A0A3B0RAD2_9ZZZZ